MDRSLDCLSDAAEDAARPVHAVRSEAWSAFLSGLPPEQAAYLTDLGFKAEPGALAFLPGSDGVAAAVLGLPADPTPESFGDLAFRLPHAIPWRFAPGHFDAAIAVLGFCLGAYRFSGHTSARPPARLTPPHGVEPMQRIAAAIWWARDLINTPANRLGPAELANAARDLAEQHGASFTLCEGEALQTAYPTVAAVGAGSDRPPCVAALQWAGRADGPLVALCGKGVCFDTGGYNIKSSASMRLMKKDMGGAAIMLAVARLVMEANLPVRLSLRIGCVENSISGTAMRPGDVLTTRRGLTVEVGDTDAEGRLVLCDLLAAASDEDPALLLDAATLTGAARVALGPDLPALLTNDESLAEAFLQAGESAHDPVWRLPLWKGYDSWLTSKTADLCNISSKPYAGAITAALFLQRFLRPGTRWAHLDTFAWAASSCPGHPEGGDTQGLRALFTLIQNTFVCSQG